MVRDANGQSLAYVYSQEKESDARIAKVLTPDEARRIASNIAKLPTRSAQMTDTSAPSRVPFRGGWWAKRVKLGERPGRARIVQRKGGSCQAKLS